MSPSSLPASAFEALELPSEIVTILTTPQPAPPSAASPNVLQAAPEPASELSANQSSITLYAELLLNIRTVTLFASLRSVHSRDTSARLSADGSSITITHEGESATIHLPIKVKGGGDATLSLPAQPPSKELSLRLQIEETEGTELLNGFDANERNTNLVPWDGASLDAAESVLMHCRNCQATVLPKARVSDWRDLPNENWAEMMDFWHCHKPDEHHLHDHSHESPVASKGYAAGSRLTAAKGVGFVDLASVLLKDSDCTGIELLNAAIGKSTSLKCKHCNYVLGVVDVESEGWRIWKWSIALTSKMGPHLPEIRSTHAIQKWITARLLFLIENQGVRKFHIHPDFGDATNIPSLLIWIFTPDLMFSSSVTSPQRNDPTRAMKVFYQEQVFRLPKPGEPEIAAIEDVTFPAELYEELGHALEANKQLLPVNARRFQGWQVSFLGRFIASGLSENIPK